MSDWDMVCIDYLPRIYNFFLYRVRDRWCAEELSATAMEQVWRDRRKYCPQRGALSTWIFTITRRVYADYMRHPSREISFEEMPQIVATFSVEELAERNANLRKLNDLLSGISESEKELIALKFGAGLNNREIAKVIGLSESNVGTTLHRVVSKLRKAWGNNE